MACHVSVRSCVLHRLGCLCAGGVRSEEEARALHARIEKLTTVLEGVNVEHAMLLEQVRPSMLLELHAWITQNWLLGRQGGGRSQGMGPY